MTERARSAALYGALTRLDGKDGTNGTNGKDGTNGTNGNDGASGFNVATRLTPFASSAGCPNGGVRIDSGLDLNRDGKLEDSEVSSSAVVCNGGGSSPIADAGAPGTAAAPIVFNSTIPASETAISIGGGTALLDNLRVMGNHQGVEFDGTGTGTLSNSVIENNSNSLLLPPLPALTAGVGISASSSQFPAVLIINDVVRGNDTGIFLGGNAIVMNSTISANKNLGISAGPSTQVVNSIITSNPMGAFSGPPGVASNLDTFGNSPDYTGPCTNCIHADPTFVAGPATDLHLLPGSACLGIGTFVGRIGRGKAIPRRAPPGPRPSAVRAVDRRGLSGCFRAVSRVMAIPTITEESPLPPSDAGAPPLRPPRSVVK